MKVLKGKTIGFIGVGRMGEAMVRGLVACGVSPKQILVYDTDARRRSALKQGQKVRVALNNADVAAKSAVVVLAVKPQQIDGVLGELDRADKAAPLYISIAAGVPLERIRSALGGKARLVRVMPNTPALIRQGVSAYFAGKGCGPADRKVAEAVLGALGEVVEVKEEKLMDPVTGLSGSGPAYIYVIIDALADAGVKAGLTRDVALRLAAATAAGAARMVLETERHPGELKDMVTSPGGTTAAGLYELEKGGLRGLLIRAVEAATRRSEELGKKKG